MFDLEIYGFQHRGKSVRLSHAMSFASSKVRSGFQRDLTLVKAGKNQAVKSSFDAILEHVPEIEGEGFVLLMDPASLKVIEGWSAAEIGVLIHMATQDIDGMGLLAAADQSDIQFFPIDAAFGHMTGLVRANGDCEALRIKRVGQERRSTAVADNKGWRMMAIEVSSELKDRASDEMMQKAGCDDEQIDLTELFWRDVAAKAKDPFVRQEPLVLMLGGEQCLDEDCDCKTRKIAWLQPAPRLTFRTGCENELMNLLKSYFELALNGPKGDSLRNRLDVTDGDIVVMFQAGYGELQPCTMMVNDWGVDLLNQHRLLNLIIRTMHPTASSLHGGPKLSQSQHGPASFTCLLTRMDFGATPVSPIQPCSGHELLSHSTRLINWLVENGASEAYAQRLVVEI